MGSGLRTTISRVLVLLAVLLAVLPLVAAHEHEVEQVGPYEMNFRNEEVSLLPYTL